MPMPPASSSPRDGPVPSGAHPVGDPRPHSRPERGLLQTVERDRADHHREHGHEVPLRLQRRKPRERGAQHELPPPPLDGRHSREQPEVDGERLAPGTPRLDPEDTHAEKGHARVRERRGGDGTGRGARRREQLQPGEGEEPGGRRPVAELLRVRKAGPEPLAEQPAAGPRHPSPDCPPGVEGSEHVAEEKTCEHEADPEGDVDECRHDVADGALHTGEPRPQEEDEQRDADDAAEHVRDPARQRSGQHGREGLHAVVGEERSLPECAERHERDDENDRGRPTEEPFGDREVGASAEPMGEDGGHGSTTTLTITASLRCDSSSKTPSSSAWNWNTAGLSGVAFFESS